MKTFVETYFSIVSTHIDEQGVYPHQMITMNKKGEFGMFSLMLNKPHEVYGAVKKAFADQPAELIYGLDRFSKPGQGIELGDFLAGAYWNGLEWRPFILEYQNEPRVVKPINWDNAFWNNAIIDELKTFKIVA